MGVSPLIHRGKVSSVIELRKPGGCKLVYDKKTQTIKEVQINRWRRFLWWLGINR